MATPRRSWVRRLAALMLVGVASVPLFPGESTACSTAPAEVLEVRSDADAAAGAAPGPVGDAAVAVTRGVGPTDLGCGKQMESSCDELGSITLTFGRALDGDSPPGDVGYVVELVGGELPDGLRLPSEPLLGSRGEVEVSVDYRWIDGSDDAQEPISFEVTIHAVDVDGHAGPRSEPIAVVDLGR